MKPVHVLIVVLVAIAMLFLIAVAIGVSKPPKPARPGDPDAVGILSKLTDGAPFLRPQDARGCTPDGSDEFEIAQPCTIEFPDRGLLKKPTKVALEVGSGAVLVTVDPNAGPPLKARVPRTVKDEEGEEETQDCYGMSMTPKGGTLTIAPQDGSTAEIEILDEECEE